MGLLLHSLGRISSAAKALPIVSQESCTALAKAPQALCLRQPAALVSSDRDTQFMALPSSVRNIALQRRDFCKAVCMTARIDNLPLKTACAKVIASNAGLYPDLRGKGGSSALNYSNFRVWMHRLGKTRGAEADWHNLVAVADRYIGHGRPAVIETEGGQLFFRLVAKHYEHENKLSLKESYRLAVDLGKRGGLHPEMMPSYEQVAYHYAHKIDKPSVLMARMGKEWAENHLAGYITRDWSEVETGSLWFGDHHVFDAPCCIDEDIGAPKACRPWLTGWFDVKAGYLVGWIIRAGEHPDSLAIEDALLNGICANNNRPPAILYTDNGKDYVSRGFAEPVVTPDGSKHSITIELGCRVINALPYNARAKTIERFFKNVAGSFARYWAAYLGNRPGCRPEAAQYFWTHPETLPNLQEFCAAFAWWLENIWNKQGNAASEIAGGVAPQEAWDARPAGRPAFSKQQLYSAFLKPVGERTVGPGGRVSVARRAYQSRELWPLVRQSVLIKIDRFDLSHVWAFRFDGTQICELKQVEAISAVNANPEKLSEAMANNRRMLKHCRELHQERTGERKIGAPVSRLQIAQDETPAADEVKKPPVRRAPATKANDNDVAMLEAIKYQTLNDANADAIMADIEMLQRLNEKQGRENHE